MIHCRSLSGIHQGVGVNIKENARSAMTLQKKIGFVEKNKFRSFHGTGEQRQIHTLTG